MPPKNTSSKSESHAEYQREWRKKLTQEQKEAYKNTRRARIAKKKEKEQAELLERVKARSREYNKRAYIKRTAKNAIILPSTPKSRAKVINSIIDEATPRTSKELAKLGIKKSHERQVTC